MYPPIPLLSETEGDESKNVGESKDNGEAIGQGSKQKSKHRLKECCCLSCVLGHEGRGKTNNKSNQASSKRGSQEGEEDVDVGDDGDGGHVLNRDGCQLLDTFIQNKGDTIIE